LDANSTPAKLTHLVRTILPAQSKRVKTTTLKTLTKKKNRPAPSDKEGRTDRPKLRGSTKSTRKKLTASHVRSSSPLCSIPSVRSCKRTSIYTAQVAYAGVRSHGLSLFACGVVGRHTGFVSWAAAVTCSMASVKLCLWPENPSGNVSYRCFVALANENREKKTQISSAIATRNSSPSYASV